MNVEFEHKPIDVEGEETLKAIAAADKFNEWMFDTIAPFCKGNILEIGSGIGNISKIFLDKEFNITLSDIRENYCDILKKDFSTYKNCKGIVNLDLVDPGFDVKYKSMMSTFDTVFALNVIEHIQDDQLALHNCHKLVSQGGHLIILVPAYQSLYNRFDAELEHYRRYTEDSLAKLIEEKFIIIHKQYFNFAGIAGWVLSGKILKKKTIPSGQMKIYNRLVPVFKFIDKIIMNKVGLSVVQIGKK